MNRIVAGFVLAAMVGSACSSGSSGATAPADVAAERSEVTSAPTTEFCTAANSFVTNSDVRLVTTPDAEVFERIDGWLDSLVAIAPGEIAAAAETLQGGFAAIDDAYAATGYEPAASFDLAPEIQDSSARASGELERYLIEWCGLQSVRREQIAAIQLAFGVDDSDLAECLHTQLGDVANIEPSSLTPELMTTPVCGTSIFGLLSGSDADS